MENDGDYEYALFLNKQDAAMPKYIPTQTTEPKQNEMEHDGENMNITLFLIELISDCTSLYSYDKQQNREVV